MQKPFSRGRRSFVKRLAWLAGTVGVMGIPAQGLKHGDSGSPAHPRRGKGYRMTAHIRDYYRSADD